MLKADYIAYVIFANEPCDNNRLKCVHSSWAGTDGLIYLTEGLVFAASVNLFHALLVSIRHTLSCSLKIVWELPFPCGLGSHR